MTTIYVNHNLGVVLTDTRTTTTHSASLFGFTISSVDTYNDDGLKAIYVHDRIFVESGSCSESTKILQYLVHGTEVKPAPAKHDLNSVCLLVDKNWVLELIIQKGVFKKRFNVVKNTAWYYTGSGSAALAEALKEYNSNITLPEAIDAFKKVHLTDRFTNDQIRIYHM